jgi:MFS transporter, ACS family, tartrate transporter
MTPPSPINPAASVAQSAARPVAQGAASTVGDRARRRIARRLVPFLFILYVFNYIDRVNISYAALQMTNELQFSSTVFGTGAGIFFIGYFLLQLPATMLVELWSARKFIGASLIIWGTLATMTGFIHNATQFYWIRFLLGFAEAGFFPGAIVYLTHWYTKEDRAKAVALFMIAIPMSNMLGAAVASVLMQITWLGYSGWRWLLILEGFPSVLAGIFALYYLTDRPKDAMWLGEDERRWITDKLSVDQAAKKAQAKMSPWQAMRQPAVILLALAYFCYITNSVGLGTWLPKIIQRISGLSTTQVILLSGIPWLAAIPMMIWSAWHSDRSGERRLHAAIPILLVGVALWMSIKAGTNILLAIAAFSVATMALYSFPSPFWALPTLFLSGSAAAATVALINSIGNLGGFLGPYVVGYLTDKTGDFNAGIYYLCLSGVVGGLSVLALRRSVRADA